MVLFVVTTYTTDWYGWELDVVAETDLPCHLYLSWLPTYPPALPKYKTRQGRAYQCGWSFNWAGALVTEQLEPGPTTTHTFNLDGLTSDQDSWWALSECGPPAAACASTPPLPIVNIQPAFATLGSHDPGPIPPASNYVPLWDELQASNKFPTPPTPFTDWVAPTTGKTFCVLVLGYNAPTAGLVTMSLEDLTTATTITTTTQPYGGGGFYPSFFPQPSLVKGHTYRWTTTNLGPDPATLDPVFGNARTSVCSMDQV